MNAAAADLSNDRSGACGAKMCYAVFCETVALARGVFCSSASHAVNIMRNNEKRERAMAATSEASEPLIMENDWL